MPESNQNDISKIHACSASGVRHNGRFKFSAMNIIDKIGSEQLKTGGTEFRVGDTVKVHSRVVEGDKERIQIYSGIVIGRKGGFRMARVSNGYSRCIPRVSPKSKSSARDRSAVRN